MQCNIGRKISTIVLVLRISVVEGVLWVEEFEQWSPLEVVNPFKSKIYQNNIYMII